MKSIVILYHATCTDGFSAAWAAWKKFGARADYFPVRYQAPLPENLTHKTIYFVDFCPAGDDLKHLQAHNKKVVIIDHHQSAGRFIELATSYLYDQNHSGAVLAWRYFHPKKKLPRLLSYVEDADLWRWQLPHSKIFSAYIFAQTFDFKIWSKLAADFDDSSRRREVRRVGEILLSEERKHIDMLVDTAVPVRFHGYQIMAVNTSDFVSDVGHVLYTKYPPFSLMWHERGDGLKVSLRSDGSVNVADIAEQYGGGGHPAAASFKLPPGQPIPWERLSG